MAPTGYLDIHGHFYLPPDHEYGTSGEELQAQFHKLDFLAPEPVVWSAEATLQSNAAAGIDMQMLSYIPPDHAKLRAANDHGRGLVTRYPSRFGLLAALPTDDPAACLAEIDRTSRFTPHPPDGFAVLTEYNGVGLGDPRLEPVWAALDHRAAVVHVHPNAYAAGVQGRPSPLIEVAFDTCRTAVDLLFRDLLTRFPHVTVVLAHCGGALPALSGRVVLLGPEPWVPNPRGVTRQRLEAQLTRFWVDTAATARTGLAPAVAMVGSAHVVYGSDCGVPCSTTGTMDENMRDVLEVEKELGLPAGTVATNGWSLFPDAAVRAGKFGHAREMPML